jgi:hypothetical protein
MSGIPHFSAIIFGCGALKMGSGYHALIFKENPTLKQTTNLVSLMTNYHRRHIHR